MGTGVPPVAVFFAKNLIEALELFFESADPTEVARRLHGEVFVTRVEVLIE